MSNGAPGFDVLTLNSGPEFPDLTDSSHSGLALVIQVNVAENKEKAWADSLAGPCQHAGPAARLDALPGSLLLAYQVTY